MWPWTSSGFPFAIACFCPQSRATLNMYNRYAQKNLVISILPSSTNNCESVCQTHSGSIIGAHRSVVSRRVVILKDGNFHSFGRDVSSADGTRCSILGDFLRYQRSIAAAGMRASFGVTSSITEVRMDGTCVLRRVKGGIRNP